MSAIALSSALQLVEATVPGARAPSADPSLAVQLRVENVFTHFYVGDTKADLATLRAKHPPEVDLDAYLKACVNLLAPWVGAKEAKELLQVT